MSQLTYDDSPLGQVDALSSKHQTVCPIQIQRWGSVYCYHSADRVLIWAINEMSCTCGEWAAGLVLMENWRRRESKRKEVVPFAIGVIGLELEGDGGLEVKDIVNPHLVELSIGR